MSRKKSCNGPKYYPTDEELVRWLANGAVNYPHDWDQKALQPILRALSELAKVRLRELEVQHA